MRGLLHLHSENAAQRCSAYKYTKFSELNACLYRISAIRNVSYENHSPHVVWIFLEVLTDTIVHSANG